MFTRAHLGPLALLTLLTTGAGVALAQAPTLSAPPIVGRWDLTVHGARGDYPSWLEVWTSGNEHLVGQFVGSGGSARPVSLVEFADGKVRFSIPPQWDKRPDNETYEATLSGDTLEGWTTDRTGKRLTFIGKRAPSLARTGTPTWGDPVKLTTRSSWREAKGWTISDDGVLASLGKADNLVSTQSLQRLHAPRRVPPAERQQQRHLPPRPLRGADRGQRCPRAAAQSHRRDLRVPGAHVGRAASAGRVADLRYHPGRPHRDRGVQRPARHHRARDSRHHGRGDRQRRGIAGPIMLQGDHGAIEYRNITIRPAR